MGDMSWLSHLVTTNSRKELESFLKLDGWQEGDPLPLLEITRMTPAAQTLTSTVFNDKVKDLANIRDIKKW